MSRTLRNVYQTHCKNYPNCFWGLGDILRGTCALFAMTKGLNGDQDQWQVELYLKNHPMGEFFIETESKHIDPNSILFYIHTDHNKVLELCKSDATGDVNVSTNLLVNDEKSISAECKTQIRRALTPRLELLLAFQRACGNVDSFRALHIRVCDNFPAQPSFEQLQKIEDQVTVLGNELCVSNSAAVRDHFVSKYKLRKLECGAGCHLGKPGSNRDEVLNTLVEFVALTRAKEIVSFSVYPWPSGFSYWAAQIYDVPFTSHILKL